MFEPVIAKLMKEADGRESTCIRNYGGLSIDQELNLLNIREMAPTLRKLASLCYLTGVRLKVTL